MTAMFDLDVAKTCPAATVLYDGDHHLLTVTTNETTTGVTPMQTGIEQATAIVANAMATH